MEFLNFMFSGPFMFFGCIILIGVSVNGVAGILRAIRGK